MELVDAYTGIPFWLGLKVIQSFGNNSTGLDYEI